MTSREIAEEIRGELVLFTDGSVERPVQKDNPLTVPIPASNTFVDGVATRDVVVNQETGVWVRIYLPQAVQNSPGHEGSKSPVVIHFHGGGFCVSHADWQMYYRFYAHLVKTSNVICVSVDYRLAPEHRLPAACEDCFGVVRWLRSVASGEAQESWLGQYADFSRCFLMGESAGGNLVHQTAVRAAGESVDPVGLRGCVVIHPGFVRAQPSQSEADVPDWPILTLEKIDKFLKLSVPSGSGREHPVFCPMGPLAASLDGLKLPKTLVAIANRDPLRDTQVEYYEAMKMSGQNVEVLFSENVGHYFHVTGFAFNNRPHVEREISILLNAVDHFIKTC
eukprot:Gb_23851 [translate_table: standard]